MSHGTGPYFPRLLPLAPLLTRFAAPVRDTHYHPDIYCPCAACSHHHAALQRHGARKVPSQHQNHPEQSHPNLLEHLLQTPNLLLLLDVPHVQPVRVASSSESYESVCVAICHGGLRDPSVPILVEVYVVLLVEHACVVEVVVVDGGGVVGRACGSGSGVGSAGEAAFCLQQEHEREQRSLLQAHPVERVHGSCHVAGVVGPDILHSDLLCPPYPPCPPDPRCGGVREQNQDGDCGKGVRERVGVGGSYVCPSHLHGCCGCQDGAAGGGGGVGGGGVGGGGDCVSRGDLARQPCSHHGCYGDRGAVAYHPRVRGGGCLYR